MSLFIKKIISFFIYLYGSVLAVLLISNYFINKNANFKLAPNITKIILGNSQPECAFNDSLIPHVKNLANAGETYFYGYQKLKEVLKQNPQINTVFIEFNPTNILIREDEKIWSNRFIKHQVPNNLAFFNIEDHKLLAINNSIGYKQALLKGLKLNLTRIAKNQYNFIDSIGGYRYIKWNNTKNILDTLRYNVKAQYKLKQKPTAYYDLSYLKKSIELCKNNDIDVKFIRSPYHNKFIGHKYEDMFQNYRQEVFNTIEFLDFNNFPIDDAEFGDLQHLNYKGSKKFSIWFEKFIKE
jgi:hypothetical protein